MVRLTYPEIDYVENSLSSFAEAEFKGSKIKLVDAIDIAYEIFVREVSVTLSKYSDLRIFFHHDFHVNGNDIGDTASYDPFTSSIVHYKRDKWFLFKCDIPLQGYCRNS